MYSISFTEDNEKVIGLIFIIDNNSSDDSLKKIKKNNKIFIIENKENNGFSKACNQVLNYVHPRIYYY